MSTRVIAIIAAAIATLIYGVTFTIAKEILLYIKPFGLILVRILGATIIFWLLGLTVKKDKIKPIEKEDYRKIAMAAFFGVGLNMLSFFKGLSYTTPISASVIMVMAPILVLIFSSILLKERLIPIRVIGIITGLIGAVVLIVFSNKSQAESENVMLGNFLVLVNAASYAFYLVIVKKIIDKYHPFVFIKWLYLFGLLIVFPFGISEFLEIPWDVIPVVTYFKVSFVVIFTTCITYLFNIYALSKLRPTTVGIFIYLQPLIATIYALIVGSDTIDLVKIVAAMLIFIGVYLVTKQTK